MNQEAPITRQKRVIIYARYSTDMQNDKSAQDQVHECKAYAERNGWKVVRTILDEAMSGANEHREGFQELRRAIETKECDIVLAEQIDRLTRDQEHAARLNKEARFYDVELHTTARGAVDTIQIAFGSTLGQMFLEDIAMKTRRGLAARVRSGKSAGGKSFGYRNKVGEDGRLIAGELEIVDDEARVIQRIFRMYAEGKSPLAIAAALNQEGVPAPRSGRGTTGGWRQTTINGNRQRGTGILNNELYVGRRVWNRLQYRKDPRTGKKVSRLNPEEQWQISDVPDLRIVPEDLWNAVKTRQNEQAKSREGITPSDRNKLSVNQSLKRRKHLLSGLMKCGLCGANMTVSGGDKKRYYCSASKELGRSVCPGFPGLRADIAADHILAVMKNDMMTEAAFQRFQSTYIKKLEESRQDQRAAEKAREKVIRRLEKEKANLLAAVRSGKAQDILLDELDRVAAELERKKAEADAHKLGELELPKNLRKMYDKMIEGLVDTLREEGVAGRASEVIHEMIDRIVVSYDTAAKKHGLRIDGNLVQMMSNADPDHQGGYKRSKSSIELVAGTGFEPVTFRL